MQQLPRMFIDPVLFVSSAVLYRCGCWLTWVVVAVAAAAKVASPCLVGACTAHHM
jgi:hypothetical protein